MRAKRLAPYLFVLPSLLGLLAFFYVPFLWSARFLFLGQDGGALASFQRTLQNEMFLSGSGNTMLFCLCCVPPSWPRGRIVPSACGSSCGRPCTNKERTKSSWCGRNCASMRI